MKSSPSAWWLGATACFLITSCDTSRTATDDATSAAAAATPVEATTPASVTFTRDLTQGDYRFQVQSASAENGQQLTIKARRGDALVTDPIRLNVKGAVNDAVMGDLNGNGNPELYVFTNTAGGSAGGAVEAYEFVERSFRPLTAPPKLSNDLAAGYNGQDKYEVRGNRLVRTFPLTDGQTRTVEYSLNRDGMLMPVSTPTSSTK